MIAYVGQKYKKIRIYKDIHILKDDIEGLNRDESVMHIVVEVGDHYILLRRGIPTDQIRPSSAPIGFGVSAPGELDTMNDKFRRPSSAPNIGNSQGNPSTDDFILKIENAGNYETVFRTTSDEQSYFDLYRAVSISVSLDDPRSVERIDDQDERFANKVLTDLIEKVNQKVQNIGDDDLHKLKDMYRILEPNSFRSDEDTRLKFATTSSSPNSFEIVLQRAFENPSNPATLAAEFLMQNIIDEIGSSIKITSLEEFSKLNAGAEGTEPSFVVAHARRKGYIVFRKKSIVSNRPLSAPGVPRRQSPVTIRPPTAGGGVV